MTELLSDSFFFEVGKFFFRPNDEGLKAIKISRSGIFFFWVLAVKLYILWFYCGFQKNKNIFGSFFTAQ